MRGKFVGKVLIFRALFNGVGNKISDIVFFVVR
jgi:hypothetical protein